MSARQLIIMRHAKAGPYDADDHGRELTDKGVLDASEAGEWLADRLLVPSHALVSSAARAVSTWHAVAAASGSDAPVVVMEELYNANPVAVIGILKDLPEDAGRVIFVGHNPNAEHLANLLDDGEGVPDAIDRLHEGYPTSALTVFDVPLAWAGIRRNSCKVIDFHVGRG